MEHIIGELAGKVYHFLEEVEEATLSDIAKNVEGSSTKVNMAIGWLAREEKLLFNTEGRGTLISLR